MDTAEIVVTVTGLLAMAMVAWFFFGTRQRTVAQSGAGGLQLLHVTVKGGYSPDTLVVKRGRPVRIEFDRQETSSCSDTVLFGAFGISRKLPAFKTTSVEFTPDTAGEFPFTCGMNMLRGTLIVEDAPRSE